MQTKTVPPLLFVLGYTREDDGSPSTRFTLDAFTTADPARINVLMGEEEATDADLRGDAVGVIEWDFITGLCDYVYVPPLWRRRGIATTLARRADEAARKNGLPGLTAASLRTALGEVWVRATCVPAEPLTAISWPLTPVEDIAGITDRRLLVPDDPDALYQAAETTAAGSDAGRCVRKTLDTACGPAEGVPLHRWRP